MIIHSAGYHSIIAYGLFYHCNYYSLLFRIDEMLFQVMYFKLIIGAIKQFYVYESPILISYYRLNLEIT
ncbi:MAG: hypothetical protein BWY45_01427 [Euryarchaeota archaeon ADurb.Bin294]|jgi:hypothetical protein|nr:MAG: hypothetical protein BWY45_01427 [Euryarchaeota archaeon ADurb.Bin294]